MLRAVFRILEIHERFVPEGALRRARLNLGGKRNGCHSLSSVAASRNRRYASKREISTLPP